MSLLITNSLASTNNTLTSSDLNWINFLPFIIMLVIIYFIILRPQIKRQKEHHNMLKSIVKGDEIITSGGLVGKINKITNSYIKVEIAKSVEIIVQKDAITALLPKGTFNALQS